MDSKKPKSKVTAILLMAGQGQRFNESLPKQFHNLSGKKIYLHTLDAFLKITMIDQIILVCNNEAINALKEELRSNNIPKTKVKVVEGGKTRQESSYRGLLSCNKQTDIVVIHDAVRPFVSSRIILENIEKAKHYKAVDTCIETFDTIVQKNDKSFIESIPKRSTLLRGQTPQSFDYKLILKAHEKALAEGKENSSDDCQLAINIGAKVYIVKGEDFNIKITNKLDLFIAEQLFRTMTTALSKNENDLKGKTYVVVGGTGGIGKEIINLLKKEDAKAIALSSSSEIKLDLRDLRSIKEAFNKIYKLHGKIDGLINSAGVLKIAPLKDLSHEEILKLIEVNFSGLIFSCKEAKIKDNGHIINIGSSACFKGRENSSIYSSCKAAILNFSQALAEELPKMKINIIIPERTDTKMRRENFPNENPKNLLSPKKVAETVINLLKREELTGNIIEVKKELSC